MTSGLTFNPEHSISGCLAPKGGSCDICQGSPNEPTPSLISALLVGSLFDIFIRWQIVSHALPFLVDQAEEDRGAKYIKAAPFLVKIAVSPRDKVTSRISRLDVEHPDIRWDNFSSRWNFSSNLCTFVGEPEIHQLFSTRWVFQETGEWLTTALKSTVLIIGWICNNEMVDGTQMNDFPLGRETQLTAGGISCYVDQTGAQWGAASDRGD